MTANVLTQEFVFAALEAECNGEQFPIALNDVWEMSGYANKNEAYRFLTQRTSLKRGLDYSANRLKSPSGGRPEESIMISFKGFRFFLAKSNTPKGDETLWHLIEIEDAYKANLERQLQASLQPSAPDTSKELQELQEKHDKLEQQLKVIDKIVDQMNNDLARVVDNTYEVITMNALAKDPCQKLVLNYSLYIATHPILRQMKEMFYR